MTSGGIIVNRDEKVCGSTYVFTYKELLEAFSTSPWYETIQGTSSRTRHDQITGRIVLSDKVHSIRDSVFGNI